MERRRNPPTQAAEHGEQNETSTESKRIISFCQTVMGIVAAIISLGISGYKDITVDLNSIYKTAGFSLISTFMFAVMLMMFELFTSHHALSRTILVALTGILLMATNTTFLVLINKGNAVLPMLVLPVMLIIGMLFCAEGPEHRAQDNYESAMKSASEIGSFGATAAFSMEGVIIFGYMKNPAFGGGHVQLDLAVSFFGCMICTFGTTVTAMPVSLFSPSVKAQMVEIAKHLRYTMLFSLASMAIVLAIEFLNGIVMFSFVPELIAGVVNFVVTFWNKDRAAGGQGDSEHKAELHSMLIKTVAITSLTLMAAIYAVYLGNENYDVYLKASMLILLSAIVSSLRWMVRPFDLSRTGSCAVAVAAITLVFPGLAMVIAAPLLAEIFIHLFSKHELLG